MKKSEWLIWTNDNYDEWKEAMIADMCEDECEDDFDYERYYEDCSIFFDDERCNLYKNVDGYIVAFAVLGLWDGKHNGARLVGDNVRDILNTSCGDYVKWYCDRHNVRCNDAHHDGTNHYLYRVAKNRDVAERLVHKIAYEDMSEEEFRKATKSLRPYVAKVYGW